MPHVLFPALSRRSAISIADLPCYPAAARTKLRTKLTRAAARTRSAPHRDYTAAPYLRDECTVNNIDIDDPTLQQRAQRARFRIWCCRNKLSAHNNTASDPGAATSICEGLHLSSFSPALNCLRASPQICQEPLFSSSGPFLFNLPRDSRLQPWIFSRASLVSLPSAFLQYARKNDCRTYNLANMKSKD